MSETTNLPTASSFHQCQTAITQTFVTRMEKRAQQKGMLGSVGWSGGFSLWTAAFDVEILDARLDMRRVAALFTSFVI